MCLAVPGKIVSVHEKDPLFRLGVVDFGGVTREVNLACVILSAVTFVCGSVLKCPLTFVTFVSFASSITR